MFPFFPKVFLLLLRQVGLLLPVVPRADPLLADAARLGGVAPEVTSFTGDVVVPLAGLFDRLLGRHREHGAVVGEELVVLPRCQAKFLEVVGRHLGHGHGKF